MPTLRKLLLFSCFVLVFGITNAKADSVNMSGSGVWGVNTPSTTYSTDGATWSFSVDLLNPLTDATLDNVLGGYVTQQFSSFSYFLNGTMVATTPDLLGVELFPSGNLGGLDLIFGDHSVSFYGDQLYNGTAPTLNLLLGSYSVTSAIDNVDATGSGSININTAPVATPEPASWLLLGIGLFSLLIMSRRFQPSRLTSM